MSGPLFLDTVDGASGVDTGDIGHSLRFRNGASSYLNRLFGSPTSAYRWSFSTWVKLGNLGVRHFLLNGWTDSNNRGYLEINESGVLRYDDFYGGSQKCLKVSTPVYRDPTGWLHIVCEADTDNATAEDRLRIYVNGVRVTSWSTNTNYSISTATQINWASHQHYIGWVNSVYGDDYRARTAFVDNGGGGPTAYAQFNTDINEWVSKSQSAVKAVVDAGGTNSFMLDFDNATSLTTLGYDKSSKGNNWTPNNFSLTAGTSYDWMLDVPGNSYPTWNPLAVRTGAPLSTFSAGNLNVVNTSTTAGTYANSTMPLLPGETWFEATVIGSARSDSMVGIADALVMNTVFTNTYAYLQNGNIYANSVVVTTGATYTVGDVIGVKANRTTNKLQFYKQTGGAGAFVAQGTELTINAGIEYFAHTENTNSSGYAINFGQRPLNQTGVSQSTLLCQRNMPDPAILNPEKHFDVLLHTGTGAVRDVTGTLFPPDLVWIKGRNAAYDHHLFDVARTLGNKLSSNLTAAEAASGLTGYLPNGFSLNGAYSGINGSGTNYVDWLWKAGGAAVTNNAGSISSQVSANVEAGFSIVTATTPTSGAFSVGHGLGVAPKLVIALNRTTGTSSTVYHAGLNGGNPGTSYYLQLNSTNGQASAAGVWGSVGVTSSLIGMTVGVTFTASQNIVLYCFAEIPGYSKIFSYTGNGAADGPFVHCGFKPKFVMLKNTAAGNGWIIWDAVRDTYNIVGTYLQPNVSTAEGFQGYLDFQSNGFKLKIANADANGSGNTIVGIAFADVPAKYALAR